MPSKPTITRFRHLCAAWVVAGVCATASAGPLLQTPGLGKLRLSPSSVQLPDTSIGSSLVTKGPILPSDSVAPIIGINVQPAGLTGGGRGPAPPRIDELIRWALSPDITDLQLNYIVPPGIDPPFPGLLESIGSSFPQLTSYTDTTWGPGGISNCDASGCPSEPAVPDPPHRLTVYIVAGYDWINGDAGELAFIFSLVNEGAMLILDGSDLAGVNGVRGDADDNLVFEGLDPSQPFFRAFSVSGYDPTNEQFLNAVDITDRIGALPEPSTPVLMLLAAAALLSRRRATARLTPRAALPA